MNDQTPMPDFDLDLLDPSLLAFPTPPENAGDPSSNHQKPLNSNTPPLPSSLLDPELMASMTDPWPTFDGMEGPGGEASGQALKIECPMVHINLQKPQNDRFDSGDMILRLQRLESMMLQMQATMAGMESVMKVISEHNKWAQADRDTVSDQVKTLKHGMERFFTHIAFNMTGDGGEGA